jgi:hypothetical protein
MWSGLHVLVRSDNAASVAAINNTTSRSPAMLEIVKSIFWLSVKYNFRLTSRHIAGQINVLSDALSRLRNAEFACLAAQLMSGGVYCVFNCVSHMSYRVFLSLQAGWRQICRF